VGQFAAQSARLLGADRVISIDRFPERLAMAREVSRADETINYEETDDLIELLKQMTGGRGPDVVIDAVGMEAHGHGLVPMMDFAKQKVRMQMDRPIVLREVIQACRKGGRVSIIGVYAGFVDKFPIGAFFAKGLTMRAGQCDVQKYMPMLLERLQNGDFDPTGIITHRLPLDQAPHGYEIFADKEDECVKVVLAP
jgi:threonine dehydrogenase-like Zn-dependent dehydrogenase